VYPAAAVLRNGRKEKNLILAALSDMVDNGPKEFFPSVRTQRGNMDGDSPAPLLSPGQFGRKRAAVARRRGMFNGTSWLNSS
jgi:hypothetical protein